MTACGTNRPTRTPNAVCDSDEASVPYLDVSVGPTLTKTATSSQCVIDVRYDVAVNNLNPQETLTLKALIDDVYGNITLVQGDVQSTTCEVPQTIAPNGNYSCSFVGRINICNTTVHDTVTADTTDEDNVDFAPSDDATVIVTVTMPPQP